MLAAATVPSPSLHASSGSSLPANHGPFVLDSLHVLFSLVVSARPLDFKARNSTTSLLDITVLRSLTVAGRLFS